LSKKRDKKRGRGPVAGGESGHQTVRAGKSCFAGPRGTGSYFSGCFSHTGLIACVGQGPGGPGGHESLWGETPGQDLRRGDPRLGSDVEKVWKGKAGTEPGQSGTRAGRKFKYRDSHKLAAGGAGARQDTEPHTKGMGDSAPRDRRSQSGGAFAAKRCFQTSWKDEIDECGSFSVWLFTNNEAPTRNSVRELTGGFRKAKTPPPVEGMRHKVIEGSGRGAPGAAAGAQLAVANLRKGRRLVGHTQKKKHFCPRAGGPAGPEAGFLVAAGHGWGQSCRLFPGRRPIRRPKRGGTGKTVAPATDCRFPLEVGTGAGGGRGVGGGRDSIANAPRRPTPARTWRERARRGIHPREAGNVRGEGVGELERGHVVVSSVWRGIWGARNPFGPIHGANGKCG